MSLECLNSIIADNLAIHIDLTDDKSWVNWNTGLTAFSLTKWSGAVSDDINLYDFGLTAFDNGRMNYMWSGITLTPRDTNLSLYRVGINTVLNPTTGQTSGLTSSTNFLTINPVTGDTVHGNWFDCQGGFLNGFFKLQDYKYEIFPARYNLGITIETIVNLFPYSQGIFYMMGTHGGDKYNPFFTGETITGMTTLTSNPLVEPHMTILSGVTTSEDNYLNAIQSKEVYKKAFRNPEDAKKTVYSEAPQAENLKNNLIAFMLTPDRRLAYKYINNDASIITNSSPTIITATGFTVISITFTPDAPLSNPDPDVLLCAPRRMGKLVFYVNGRAVWTVNDFPEFYFHGLKNDREKQLGVPYSITWGGGSFGLDRMHHYDYQTYVLYTGQDDNYINTNFSQHENPLIGTGLTTGLSISTDSTTFTGETVMRVEFTGGTGNTYFIKFNNPISVISNRDYTFNLSILDDGMFKNTDGSGNPVTNKITILGYSNSTDVNVVNDIEYYFPMPDQTMVAIERMGLHPFPDQQEYEYIWVNGIMYYGVSGYPVFDQNGNIINQDVVNQIIQNAIVTGQGEWKTLNSIIRSEENSGQKFIATGILIETSESLNLNTPLYIKDFTYTAADILIDGNIMSFINENFFMPFIGGIQKLRVYDKAFSSTEILHNAFIESKSNPDIKVSKGGRIIYR